MKRIDQTFERLRCESRTGLITYVTAGDPDESRSRTVLTVLDRAGADIIEVGVPFSDPVADGPVIQRASERALAGGTTLASTLALVASVRNEVQAPLVLFTYANPVYRMGLDTFAARAADAGVDGVLVLDVPVEESDDLRTSLGRVAIDLIFLISPTTTPERVALAAEKGSGFLYAISRLGVTGSRDVVSGLVPDLASRVRRVTSRPLAVGFGISRPEHVHEVGRWADAAVVGSALVDTIAKASAGPDLEGSVRRYVEWLAGRRPDNGLATEPSGR